MKSNRKETSAASSLLDYISMDYDGLSKTVAELLGGGSAAVTTLGFANDLKTFRGRDDVLTLLIHLGYLAYDEEKREVRIPNEEIRMEFAKTIREVKRDETIRQIKDRHYPKSLENYGGEILLAGISYQKDAPAGHRKHTWIIEEYEE